MIHNIEFITLGLAVGVLSGLLGIGGAVFLVPALVYLFGWQQHLAQGTTLGMLTLPIVILGAWQYYQAGNMNIKVALLLGLGVFIGGYVGGLLANHLPATTLQRVFGIVLLFIAIKMILGK